MKLVREHIIFEKFVEDSDPIEDLGIGLKTRIKTWITNMNNKNVLYSKNKISKWELNEEGKIDVGYETDWSSYKNYLLEYPSNTIIPEVIILRGDIKELPEYINFGTCWGTVFMNVSEITTLRGCPRIIYGHFCVNANRNLDSLNYFPEKIYGHVYITHCKRKFSEEEIQNICDVKGDVKV